MFEQLPPPGVVQEDGMVVMMHPAIGLEMICICTGVLQVTLFTVKGRLYRIPGRRAASGTFIYSRKKILNKATGP
jgi:hypothetical protein